MRRVLVIGTGGTISCVEGEKGLEPRLGVDELIKEIAMPDGVQVCSEQLFCVDSTNMTMRHWKKLAQRIHECYDEFDGFVITHGTDTMAYAASALSVFIQNSEKPIVLTGSMKAFDAEASDAPENLRNALLFAADPRANGVSAVFGRSAIDGRHISKIHTSARNAFESVGFPPVASFENSGITFTEPIIKHSGEVCFFDEADERIEIIYLIPGVQPPIIRDETKAVIVLGFGTGGLPDSCEDFLAELISRGIYVIMSTQVLRGGTKLSLYETGNRIKEKYPVIETGKMTVEYAAMKAMFALARSDNFEDFEKVFLNEL